MDVEARVASRRRVGGDRRRRPVGVLGRSWPAPSIVLYVGGRNQWFIRDDWAFLFTREKVHQASGLDDMLFQAQDGHWMTIPHHRLPHHPRHLRHRVVLALPDPDDGAATWQPSW